MFVQLGYGFPSAASFAGVTQSATNQNNTGAPLANAAPQASGVAPLTAGQSHTTANSTNATAVAQTPAAGGAFAAPQFAVPQFAIAQGAVGFFTPLGLVGGAGFAGGYGGYAQGTQGAPAATAQPSALATGSGHQVSNSTNSLAAVDPSQGGNAYGSASFGAPSAALPFILSPGFAQNGAPVMLALPVFAFTFMAAPAQQAPIQQAPIQQNPVQQPTPQEPSVATPAEPTVPEAPAVPAQPEPVAQVAPPVTAPVVDVAPITAPVIATPTIDTPSQPESEVVISALTNAEFARYEQEQVSSELETQLKLSLTTAEGDTITLDFSQLDILKSNNLGGVDADEKLLEDATGSEEMDRLVNMDVQGDLSADERKAVDALLEDITAVAQQFFSGSMNDAASMLRELDFDTSQLAELSLKMSMTRTTEIRSGYRDGMDQLDQLSSRGGEVMEMLDFMATEQRRLIDRAKDVFDDESAVRVVTSLIPPLLEQPAALDALAKLDSSIEALAPETEPQTNG